MEEVALAWLGKMVWPKRFGLGVATMIPWFGICVSCHFLWQELYLICMAEGEGRGRLVHDVASG